MPVRASETEKLINRTSAGIGPMPDQRSETNENLGTFPGSTYGTFRNARQATLSILRVFRVSTLEYLCFLRGATLAQKVSSARAPPRDQGKRFGVPHRAIIPRLFRRPNIDFPVNKLSGGGEQFCESSRNLPLTDALVFEEKQGTGSVLSAERRWANNFELRLAQKGREKAEEKF